MGRGVIGEGGSGRPDRALRRAGGAAPSARGAGARGGHGGRKHTPCPGRSEEVRPFARPAGDDRRGVLLFADGLAGKVPERVRDLRARLLAVPLHGDRHHGHPRGQGHRPARAGRQPRPPGLAGGRRLRLHEQLLLRNPEPAAERCGRHRLHEPRGHGRGRVPAAWRGVGEAGRRGLGPVPGGRLPHQQALLRHEPSGCVRPAAAFGGRGRSDALCVREHVRLPARARAAGRPPNRLRELLFHCGCRLRPAARLPRRRALGAPPRDGCLAAAGPARRALDPGPGAHERRPDPGDGSEGHGHELLAGRLRLPLPDDGAERGERRSQHHRLRDDRCLGRHRAAEGAPSGECQGRQPRGRGSRKGGAAAAADVRGPGAAREDDDGALTRR
mmetsp:Transcript_39383/g.112417  ORF Transcript_39383/g.112417 Transcript_39383/m.112417 type:complete len:387 (-) Transcript_39383:261-1421(-)